MFSALCLYLTWVVTRKEHCKVASVLTPLAWTRLSFYRPSSRIFIDVYSSLLCDLTRLKISSFVKSTWRQGDVTSCRERANRSADEAGTSIDLSQTWNNKHIKFLLMAYVNFDEQFHDSVSTFGMGNKKQNLFKQNDLRLIPVFLNEPQVSAIWRDCAMCKCLTRKLLLI